MIPRPPGIEDVFPNRIGRRNAIIETAREAFRLFNFREIVIPILEFTEVFVRGIGSDTDIVSKEMFTFEDRGGRSLTLRPEGTASVVRAYVENGEYNRLATCKLFYIGPMFRAERPQKGRLRQFHQFGAECFGGGDPYHDFEIIAMMHAICRKLGITGYDILINSIGCPSCRPAFVSSLASYYESHRQDLCRDCADRLQRNPLRLLDCKQESCAGLKKGAPSITDFLCPACTEHHDALRRHLRNAGIAFTDDPRLVRGLDYYTRTTFEFVTSALGGQNAFAAGGRYDSLVEQFGGKPTPAVGFAAGIERMEILLEGREIPQAGLDCFIVHSGGATFEKAIAVCALCREHGFSADIDPGGKGFKTQFKKADREGAALAIILGEDEAASETLTVKDMRSGGQERIPISQMIEYLLRKLGR